MVLAMSLHCTVAEQHLVGLELQGSCKRRREERKGELYGITPNNWVWHLIIKECYQMNMLARYKHRRIILEYNIINVRYVTVKWCTISSWSWLCMLKHGLRLFIRNETFAKSKLDLAKVFELQPIRNNVTVDKHEWNKNHEIKLPHWSEFSLSATMEGLGLWDYSVKHPID